MMITYKTRMCESYYKALLSTMDLQLLYSKP